MNEDQIEEMNAQLEAENNLALIKEAPPDTQLKVAAKLLGYKSMPPSVEEFVKDRYYLGNITSNLYPFWMSQLKDIFPTPIHTRYPIIVITGAIGIGKSTFSRIVTDYMICRLDHLRDPHKTMGMMPGKKLLFNFLMPTASSAASEFPGTLREWNEQSPYFRDGMYNGMEPYSLTSEGLIGKGRIGRDVIGYVLSELNFLPYHKAKEKLDTAFKRWSSRFQRFLDYFGFLIIDTSANRQDSITDEFIANNPYGDKVKVIRATEWGVRTHLNYYGRKGWFKVYAGDALHSPFIVDQYNPITPDLDIDRVIEVPEELRADFEFGLEKALTDKAGISITSTDKFIQQPELIKKCYNIRQGCLDVIDVDFFDKNDKLIYQFDEAVRKIPDDKIIFIHFDIGVVSDKTGLAISYFDKWEDYGVDSNNKKMKLPRIIVPLAVSISRRKDQETSIFKLQEFVIDMSERNELYFSADSFCSRQLFQNLTMLGIKNNYLSVDRTDQPYILLKTQLTNGLISLPQNEVLENEVAQLRRVGKKIDHPANGCFRGDTEILVIEGNGFRNKRIDGVVPGDKIMTYNEDTGFSISKVVSSGVTRIVYNLVNIQVGNTTISCTEDHKFLTTKGYKVASKLTTSDILVNLKGNCRITRKWFREYSNDTPVYDIEVASKNHNFCLANGIVVHNSKDCADAVAGSVANLYNHLDIAGQLSNKYRIRGHIDAIGSRKDYTKDQYQSMLENIFR